ncbi:MAG: NAD-dependent epimerase/dehydratase family protein [Magnetococcales bacterium]|nr:NAD-dependent epimerase/dehydratase family protein [Magnetococcales bacterium]
MTRRPVSIAILGATSQIAQDLILSFAADGHTALHLFARRPEVVSQWLAARVLPARYPVATFAGFGQQDFDVVINFVGVGNPAQTLALGNTLLDTTLQYDLLVLDYLRTHPACRYLFLSSGAAYGARFSAPVTEETPAVIPINALSAADLYGVAKLYAECRHRAHPEWAIVDMRVFNYFSHTQDLAARFFVTDMLRAIRDGEVLSTSPDYMVRDFLHPTDFYRLVQAILAAPPTHAVLDCYSRAPIDKPTLLAAMQEKFGLQYQVTAGGACVNATGAKPYYYSLNRRAAAFGYQPGLTSLEGIVQEAEKILGRPARSLSIP